MTISYSSRLGHLAAAVLFSATAGMAVRQTVAATPLQAASSATQPDNSASGVQTVPRNRAKPGAAGRGQRVAVQTRPILAHEPLAHVIKRLAAEARQRSSADPVQAARGHSERLPEQYGNIRVDQYRGPEPEGVYAMAVNPADPDNIAINAGSLQVSTTYGRTWIEDFYPVFPVGEQTDEVSYTAPAQQNYYEGISFDRTGHTYTAAEAFNQSSAALDTMSGRITSQNHGLSLDNRPQLISSSECNDYDFRCDILGVLGVTTDNSGTSTDGQTYVLGWDRCDQEESCDSGLDSGQSAIYVNGGYVTDQDLNAQEGSVFVDAAGGVHVVAVSYSDDPTLSLYLDELFRYDSPPFAQFVNNPSNSNYGNYYPVACVSYKQTGYCAFQATQVNGGPAQSHPDIYLAAVNLQTGAATVSRVNNDAFGKGKDHFDATVAVNSAGDVYVGWFDNRDDPKNIKLNYFVGKSTDGGKTFPLQKPVNDVPFDLNAATYPSIPSGVLAAGPDGAVHAAWTDTRDGVGLKLWFQTLRF